MARLLVLGLFTTLAIVSIVHTVFDSREGRSRTIAQLESVIVLKHAEISSWTNSLRLNLDVVVSETGTLGAIRTLASPDSPESLAAEAHDQIQDHFLWAADHLGLFEELFFMDTEGTVLVSTVPGHEAQLLGLSDYFLRGLEGDYLQQPSYSLSLGRMTIVASRPIRYKEETLGVVAARADLAGLNNIMTERAGLGETGETYLVGRNYRLLTDLRLPGYSIPVTYIRTTATESAVGSSQGGSATYDSYTGNTVIGVYDWIPQLQVALVAEQQESEALKSTWVTLLIVLGCSIVAITILAALASATFTRRLASRLVRLGEVASRIAAGELELVADIERDDEIGGLARSFNSMTSQLRKLVRSLSRQTSHLRTINEAGLQITSILDSGSLLPHVTCSLTRMFNYEEVRIFHFTSDESGHLFTCTRHDRCTGATVVRPNSQSFADPTEPVCPQAISTVVRTGRRLLVDSSFGRQVESRAFYAEIALPIKAKGELLGVLDIITTVDEPADADDLLAAETLTNQLAIAIQNSRLFRKAEELSASRERERLARDLHDAVSQTLFSVSLISEVLPRVFRKDPEEGKRRLQELRVLARGALAEMRTLLLEMRPATLAEVPLPQLLQQLGEMTLSRAQIPTTVETDDRCAALPVDVRVALYHIAQEALNNVAKHSEATSARLKLSCGRNEAQLVIEDNGIGLDSGQVDAGHLGLKIMHERAESVGGRLEVKSAPRKGTKITVSWAATSAP